MKKIHAGFYVSLGSSNLKSILFIYLKKEALLGRQRKEVVDTKYKKFLDVRKSENFILHYSLN